MQGNRIIIIFKKYVIRNTVCVCMAYPIYFTYVDTYVSIFYLSQLQTSSCISKWPLHFLFLTFQSALRNEWDVPLRISLRILSDLTCHRVMFTIGDKRDWSRLDPIGWSRTSTVESMYSSFLFNRKHAYEFKVLLLRG